MPVGSNMTELKLLVENKNDDAKGGYSKVIQHAHETTNKMKLRLGALPLTAEALENEMKRTELLEKVKEECMSGMRLGQNIKESNAYSQNTPVYQNQPRTERGDQQPCHSLGKSGRFRVNLAFAAGLKCEEATAAEPDVPQIQYQTSSSSTNAPQQSSGGVKTSFLLGSVDKAPWSVGADLDTGITESADQLASFRCSVFNLSNISVESADSGVPPHRKSLGGEKKLLGKLFDATQKHRSSLSGSCESTQALSTSFLSGRFETSRFRSMMSCSGVADQRPSSSRGSNTCVADLRSLSPRTSITGSHEITQAGISQIGHRGEPLKAGPRAGSQSTSDFSGFARLRMSSCAGAIESSQPRTVHGAQGTPLRAETGWRASVSSVSSLRPQATYERHNLSFSSKETMVGRVSDSGGTLAARKGMDGSKTPVNSSPGGMARQEQPFGSGGPSRLASSGMTLSDRITRTGLS